MNELMLRELLEHAVDAEPPAPQLARNSLLLGIRLRRRRRAKVGASSVAVLAVAAVSAPALIGAVHSPGSEPAGAAGAPIAYVVSSGRCPGLGPATVIGGNTGCHVDGSVTAIDTATRAVIETIKIPPQPVSVVLAPDRRTLYVADRAGITPVDLVTGSAGKSVNVGRSEAAFLQMAVTPDSKTVYVANYNTNSVIPIDAATNQAGRPIRVGSAPDAIAITPDGKTAYVANGNAHSVTPISIPANTAGQPIQTGDWPGPLAITPDGRTLYVADNGADTVTPISTATNEAGPPVKVGPTPAWLVVTPDGKTVYAMAAAGRYALIPISTATNQPGKPVYPVRLLPGVPIPEHGKLVAQPSMPWDMAVAPRGATVYVTNGTKAVLPISAASGAPGALIRTRASAYDIAVTPDGKAVYVTDLEGDTVTPINPATGTAGRPIKVGVNPVAIVVAP